MNKLRNWGAAWALATMVGSAPAALVLQSNNVEVLDTDTNLLWLHSWRPNENDPLKTWAEGNAWAAALTVGGAAAGAWRLPTFAELADLWADPAVGESNNGLDNNFINVQGTSLYWSSTTNSQNANLALAFSPQTGGDIDFNKNSNLYTVAVRSAGAGPGPSAVPEPHSAALALLGLSAVALQRRRQRPGRARAGA